jgi:hypothetical protein
MVLTTVSVMSDNLELNPELYYPIHCSKERYEEEYSYPEGAEVRHVPHNGRPFSAFTMIILGKKAITVQFGAGGYYPDIAEKHIRDVLGVS